MMTLDSAAQGQEAALQIPDVLGVFRLFSLSTQIMQAQPNSYRRNAVVDEPPRALSQESWRKSAILKKKRMSMLQTAHSSN